MLGEYFERASVARSLATRGEFADPFSSLATGPTTHVSPVYPILLAAVMRLFGETPSAAVLLTLLCLLMQTLYPILLFSFTQRIFSSFATAVATAAAAIVIPHFPPMIHVETLYLVNMLLISFVVTWRLRNAKASSSHHAIIEGILGGVCTLLNAAAVVIWIMWIAFLYWRRKIRGRNFYASVAILTASFLVVMSPWMLRNYHVFGAPIMLRGNLGLELAISNRDGAAASTVGNGRNGNLARFHPNFNAEEATTLRDEGEVEYNRRKWNEAWSWIFQNPLSFASLTTRRFGLFWFPSVNDAPSAYIISFWILTLLAVAGIIRLWRDKSPVLILALSIYVAYPALLYLIQSSLVYVLPIAWLHVVCAGYLLASIPLIRRGLSRLDGAPRRTASKDDRMNPLQKLELAGRLAFHAY